MLPPSPAPPGSGCPQLHRPATTGSAAKVSHLHSKHSASRRTHDLRHTHATLALAAGVHPKVVQERLGHSSIAVTLDTYSHAIPALQEDAAARLAALVDGGA
ncbi:MAG: tyrosine-type recombinase/integrase [Acidothermales bacterium]|nr:tyrosine-type recombinase/integrase [Acidothermales bacterium]